MIIFPPIPLLLTRRCISTHNLHHCLTHPYLPLHDYLFTLFLLLDMLAVVVAVLVVVDGNVTLSSSLFLRSAAVVRVIIISITGVASVCVEVVGVAVVLPWRCCCWHFIGVV